MRGKQNTVVYKSTLIRADDTHSLELMKAKTVNFDIHLIIIKQCKR